MIRFYPNSQGKVVILSYLAPSYIAPNVTKSKTCHVKRKYSLPDDYIFYPAKFWPHKNHKNLINALGILKEHGKRVNLVLTGSKNADFSSFYEVMGLVEEKDLKDQVFYLGFVNNEELSAIYKMAKAMIMPTFFGPTNIPILEAWVMGTPVITSDIRGCRDQLGDAGLLVDPKSSTDMAKKVWKIYNDGELRKTLIERGKIRVNRWTFEDFSKRIAMVLKDFETQKNASSKNN
jgi:glycosyltransferase involved in cell wall biosynthesis